MLIISTLQEDHALFLCLVRVSVALFRRRPVATGRKKTQAPEELIIILIIQYYNE